MAAAAIHHQHELEAGASLLRYKNGEECKYARRDDKQEFVKCYTQAEYDAYQAKSAYQRDLALPYIGFGIIVFVGYVILCVIYAIYDKKNK